MKNWEEATLVKSDLIAPGVKKLLLKLETPRTHIAGQFYLVSPDLAHGNYSREYSLANSTNNQGIIELGVQKIEGGVVSTYLHEMTVGQKVKVKGPMGKYFNWEEEYLGQVVFIAGGAGIVPYMSMIRLNPKNEITLLASFKTPADILYYQELLELQKSKNNFQLFVTLTRETPKSWDGLAGRINLKVIERFLQKEALYYVCGRTSFVEDISQMLTKLGIGDEMIRRERFG